VDFEQKLIVLREHKTCRTQTRSQPRVIAMHPVIVKLLKWLQNRNTTEHVFVTLRGTPWNKDTLGHRLRRAREKAGVSPDAKLYGIRHAFGTRGVLRGCDIKTLSMLMGHTTTRMTEHYTHLADQHEHLAAAMRQVNDSRRGA
jgi:site-specific recombinase XerD